MKFAKFAVLCAIALMLFATPRSARADGWVEGKYVVVYGVHHGRVVARENSITVAAGGIWPAADCAITSSKEFIWQGTGTPSRRSITINVTVDAIAWPASGGRLASASSTLLSAGVSADTSPGNSLTVKLITWTPEGATGIIYQTALQANAAGASNADATWTAN